MRKVQLADEEKKRLAVENGGGTPTPVVFCKECGNG